MKAKQNSCRKLVFGLHLWSVCSGFVLEGFLGNFITSTYKDLVIIGRDVVTAQPENFILWYTTAERIYLPNLSGLAHTRPFKTSLTTWPFIPGPVVWRVMIIAHSLRLSSSSKSNGWPLAFPIAGVKSIIANLCPCFAFSFKFSL